jgi:hypothetical protein
LEAPNLRLHRTGRSRCSHPAGDLAALVGAHAHSLYRLLRALSTVGIFREIDDKRFVRSPMSNPLGDFLGEVWVNERG